MYTASDQKIYLIGSGGHGLVVAATLIASGRYPDAVLDDNPIRHGERVCGIQVIGGTDILKTYDGQAILALGDNALRKKKVSLWPNVRWATAIHPSACVHESVKVGEGSVIMAGVVVQPECVIGKHSIINTGATLDHQNIIGDYTHVAPGGHLAGNVVLEEGAFVGTGASVIPNVRIGAWSILGAGGVAINDVRPYGLAVGVPAREHKKI